MKILFSALAKESWAQVLINFDDDTQISLKVIKKNNANNRIVQKQNNRAHFTLVLQVNLSQLWREERAKFPPQVHFILLDQHLPALFQFYQCLLKWSPP